MGKKILICRGHPDPQHTHLCDALIDQYKKGAEEAGHQVELLDVSSLQFDLLRTQDEWENGDTPVGLVEAEAAFFNADHLVFVYPLWLGTMPALFKGFLEQVLRSRLHKSGGAGPLGWRRLFRGKSARIIITMGMPGFVFRWFFSAHGLKILQQNILGFIGVKPIRSTIFGMVEHGNAKRYQRWFAKMKKLGAKAI